MTLGYIAVLPFTAHIDLPQLALIRYVLKGDRDSDRGKDRASS